MRGRRVVITGGASGIGQAAGLALAHAGARVVLADVDCGGSGATVGAIRSAGGMAECIETDVGDAASVERLFARAIDLMDGIDCAVNCAGIECPTLHMARVSEQDFDRVMRVNVKGIWLCMQRELDAMIGTGRGSIVNVASVAGLIGARMAAAYAASKHAVIGLTRSAALEYADSGIRINAVCPGPVNTPMLERWSLGNQKIKQRMTAMIPMGRAGEPEEVASAIAWLCGDGSSFVTGQTLVMDGGMAAG